MSGLRWDVNQRAGASLGAKTARATAFRCGKGVSCGAAGDARTTAAAARPVKRTTQARRWIREFFIVFLRECSGSG